MGLYLYGCYTPKRNVQVQLPDGKRVEACVYRYICKPYHDDWASDIVSLGHDWGYAHKTTAMKVARIRKLWEGITRPRYTIHVMSEKWNKDTGTFDKVTPVTGDLCFSSLRTPVLWLEEYRGVLPMGRVERARGGLWRMQEWGSGYSVNDPVRAAEWKVKCETQYRQALDNNSKSG
jgi:hypothetical protein